MEEQGARARAEQNVLFLVFFFVSLFLFLADRGEGDQRALLGSAMPV